MAITTKLQLNICPWASVYPALFLDCQRPHTRASYLQQTREVAQSCLNNFIFLTRGGAMIFHPGVPLFQRLVFVPARELLNCVLCLSNRMVEAKLNTDSYPGRVEAKLKYRSFVSRPGIIWRRRKGRIFGQTTFIGGCCHLSCPERIWSLVLFSSSWYATCSGRSRSRGHLIFVASWCQEISQPEM